MPVHDWTRVEAGLYHDFHTAWIGMMRTTLNEGLLPKGFYALAEQHAGRFVTDVLTLHASPALPAEPPPILPDGGGILLAEAPPRVQRKQVIAEEATARRRSLAIRHVSGHRLVALLEIVSPANKDRPEHVEEFATKAASALDAGVHVLLVDILPPGLHDPRGMHDAVLKRIHPDYEPYDLPVDGPLTLASYVARPRIEIYLEHLHAGAVLTDMPLFLGPDRYIHAPLEMTYQQAYRGVPEYWRAVLEQ